MRKNILLEKENNCLKDEIKNQLFIIQTLISNENRKTQRKSWKSINPDLLDKTETPTRSNLTNRFESLHVAEENSGPENKSNGVTPKYAFSNDKPKSRHSLRHISKQGIDPFIIHKKSINDANRRPPLVINSYPEKDKLHEKLKKIVPGNTTYGHIINNRRKVKIFGTSMIKDIRSKEFNFYLERCHAKLKSYPGATAKELKHKIQFLIQIDTPDIVVIHGGCNDISPRQNEEKLTEEEIAKVIISIGSCCRDKGTNKIIISGLICRKGQYHNSRVLTHFTTVSHFYISWKRQ